jgi:hypothetical protein
MTRHIILIDTRTVRLSEFEGRQSPPANRTQPKKEIQMAKKKQLTTAGNPPLKQEL